MSFSVVQIFRYAADRTRPLDDWMILACIAEIRKCIKYREYLTYTGSVKYREYLTRADYTYHQCMRTRLNEIDIKHCSFCEMMDDGDVVVVVMATIAEVMAGLKG